MDDEEECGRPPPQPSVSDWDDDSHSERHGSVWAGRALAAHAAERPAGGDLLRRLDAHAPPVATRILVPAAEPPPPPSLGTLDDALAEVRDLERASREATRKRKRAEARDDDEDEDEEERARAVAYARSGRDPFRSKCVLCSHGDPRGFDGTSASGNRAFAKLVNMIKTGIGVNNEEELARRLANYYIRQLYVPSLETDVPLPFQREEHFIAHLRYHTLNPVLQMARLQNHVLDAMDFNRVHYRSDKNATDKLVRLGTLLVKIITASRTHTFFGQHNDVIQLDAAALGEVAVLPPGLDAAAAGPTRNTIGGATATDAEAAAAARVPRHTFSSSGGSSPVI